MTRSSTLGHDADTIAPLLQESRELEMPPALHTRRLTRTALLLGFLTVLGSGVVGYYAYVASRSVILQNVFASNLQQARGLSQYVEAHKNMRSPTESLRDLQQFWEEAGQRYAGSYLCVMDSNGQLTVHTAYPDTVGNDVGKNPLLAKQGPRTLRELVQHKHDWVGHYTSSAGEKQVAAFAYSSFLDALIAVHAPASEVYAEIRATVLPWIIGFTVLTAVLLPLSLGLLHHAYVSSQRLANRTHRALQESEEQLRLVMDNVPVLIAYVDKELRYRFANRTLERWYSISPASVPGKQVTDIISHQAYEVLRQHVETALAGQTVAFEALVPYQDGSGRHVSGKYVPHTDAQGSVLGFFALIEDVSKRKQAEHERERLAEQLRQAQKMEAIGTLAGGIAHDFNNILAAILGYTELAMSDLPTDALPARYLHEVFIAGQRAKGLVQQILTFSRQSDHEPQPVQMGSLVKEAVALLRASLPSTIEIRCDIHQEAGAVWADPTHMHQILLNLCTNAAYAMRQAGGILEVRLEPIEVDDVFAALQPMLHPGMHVRLTVRDTGRGMSPAVLARVFEPFFTTKGVGEGTGMGLALVHGIVTSHGGVIMAQSTPEAGTTFEVYLPRIEQPPHTTTATEDPLPQGQGCILFVDDEAVLVRLGHTLLERLGYEIVSSTSGREALEVFRAMPQRFDLVLTDQTMPHMTGERLAQELRHIRPDIPIILCTGFSHVMNADRARALGIEAFLLKPLVARDLGRTIQQVLEKRRAPAAASA